MKCIQSDLFTNVKNKYDLIISNPPYVSISEYNESEAEFKREPKIALVAGEDGLDIINKIIVQAKQHLNANGTLIVEVGPTVAKRLKKKYPTLPFKWLKVRKPNGNEPFLGAYCIFQCNRSDLF